MLFAFNLNCMTLISWYICLFGWLMLLAEFNFYLKYVQQYLEESQNGNCYM